MKFNRITICLAVILSFLLVPWSARTAEHQEVMRATLANGLRTVIVKNTLAPVVTTQMNYVVGSNEAPEGFPGTAHAREHLMFRGSPGLSAEQLSNIAALMGGQFNADTQQTVTQYFFTVPGDDLDTALHVKAERMKGVLATQELWEEERGAIEQEVAQDLSNPEYLLNMQLLAEMFRGTPYAHDALGTANVTPHELQQAKILLLRQISLSESSIDGITGGLLSRAIQNLPLNEPIRAAKHYRETTAGQVRNAFAKWIRPSGFVQMTVGPNPE